MLDEAPYYLSVLIFIFGIYMLVASRNFFRKTIGLCLFQVGVLVFYISLGKVFNALPPIKREIEGVIYSNPLPHVLMLTAIVVGFATLSVALVLLIRIYRSFNTLDEDDLERD